MLTVFGLVALFWGVLIFATLRWLRGWKAVIGGLIVTDLAVILHSVLIYDVFHYWQLDDERSLPYAYALLWYPASVLPWSSPVFAGDFEWREEQVFPASLVLTLAMLVALAWARTRPAGSQRREWSESL